MMGIAETKKVDGCELVDEYVRLQSVKKQVEERLGEVKQEIVDVAQEDGVNFLIGREKKCFVREYEKIIYPEDKVGFIRLIREKGLYDRFSSLNYFKLAPAIRKEEIDLEILRLIRKEKNFSLTLRDK